MKIKNYAPGGRVEGPSHAQNGVPAIDQSGQQVAEIEGNERIFSVEDTQEIEQMGLAIMDASPADADKLALQLGYRIVEMVGQQDVAQAEQDAEINAEQANLLSPAQGQQNVAPQENMEQVDPALAGLI